MDDHLNLLMEIIGGEEVNTTDGSSSHQELMKSPRYRRIYEDLWNVLNTNHENGHHEDAHQSALEPQNLDQAIAQKGQQASNQSTSGAGNVSENGPSATNSMEKMHFNPNQPNQRPAIGAFLLNPVKDNSLNTRTNRSTTLKDCHGHKPTVVLVGNLSGHKILEVEATLVAKHEKDQYYSLYALSSSNAKKNSKCDETGEQQAASLEPLTVRVPVKLEHWHKNLYTFELDLDAVKIKHDSIQHWEKGYKLSPFPSGEKKLIEFKAEPNNFVDEYALARPHLALRFFCANSKEPLEIGGSEVQDNILYSKPIELATNVNSDDDRLQVEEISPPGPRFRFDEHGFCHIRFRVQIPETLWNSIKGVSYFLNLAVINHDQQDSIFQIFDNEGNAVNELEFEERKADVLVKVKKIDRNQIANCRAIGNAMERVEREWRCANGNDPFPFCDIEPEHIIPAFRLHHFRILCKLALLPKDLLGPNQQVRDQTVATFRTIEYIEDLHEHETTSSEADLRDTSVVQHSNATTWNVKPSSNHKRCQQSDGTKKDSSVQKKAKIVESSTTGAANFHSGPMEITIKHILTEEEIKLVLEPTNTVENMKSQACKVMGEAAADYRLQFDVNVILEDEKPLLDYRSQMKTPVFLVPKPRR